MMTFSPSETRVREMPRRPLARSWQSAGRVLSRQLRMVFTKLKEGCSGPRNRFRASFDTSMMLAPASPGVAGHRIRVQHSWAYHVSMPRVPQPVPSHPHWRNSRVHRGLAHNWDFCHLPLGRETGQQPWKGRQMGLASGAQACALPGVSQQSALIHESPGLVLCDTPPGKGVGRAQL